MQAEAAEITSTRYNLFFCWENDVKMRLQGIILLVLNTQGETRFFESRRLLSLSNS